MANRSFSLSFLSSIFATVAFFLSLSSAYNCNYVQFTTVEDTGISIGFGLWAHNWYAVSPNLNGSMMIFQACIGYGSVAIDGSMMAARIFATLTFIYGGMFFFGNVIRGCVNPNKRTSTNLTRSEGMVFFLTGLFQSLSLLILNSPTVCKNNQLIAQLQSGINERENLQIEFNDTCAISTGARCCIAAIVFWFLAGLASCHAKSAAKKEEEDGDNLRDPLINESLL